MKETERGQGERTDNIFLRGWKSEAGPVEGGGVGLVLGLELLLDRGRHADSSCVLLVRSNYGVGWVGAVQPFWGFFLERNLDTGALLTSRMAVPSATGLWCSAKRIDDTLSAIIYHLQITMLVIAIVSDIISAGGFRCPFIYIQGAQLARSLLSFLPFLPSLPPLPQRTPTCRIEVWDTHLFPNGPKNIKIKRPI